MTVIRGDARRLPLADESVDLVITSPPYFALRSYVDNGTHYAGQIGSEGTPQEYIAALVECTREWVRVLKPSGSMWVNLGDKYSGAGRGNHDSDALNNTAEFRAARLRTLDRRQHVGKGIIPSKSLMLLPERYRIACVDQLGLIARAVVIWSKPNGLPESVTDRVRRSHEDWVHLVRQPRYYSAVDHIREDIDYTRRPGLTYAERQAGRGRIYGEYDGQRHGHTSGGPGMAAHPLGKLPGSVWTIATEPLSVPDHISHAVCCAGVKRNGCDDGVDHFAAFPMEWPRRLILGWSPSGVCTGCGQGRRPVTHNDPIPGWVRGTPATRQLGTPNPRPGPSELVGGRVTIASRVTITGEVCGCSDTTAPARPAVILDPFAGTGTVVLVARALGRIGIGVDMSADYCRLARWRTTDPGQLAKALRVEKPPVQHAGQLDLFGEVAS